MQGLHGLSCDDDTCGSFQHAAKIHAEASPM
jgi:hypothetical protein